MTGAYNAQILLADDGGVFVSWDKWGVHVQRLTPEGLLVWPERVSATNPPNYQREQVLCPDGSGGLVIAFHDIQVGNVHRILAQRLAGDGTRLWGDSGVTICDAPGIHSNPRMTVTTDGHYVVTWHADRAYAQRMNLSGEMLWQTNGVAVGSAGGIQRNPQIVADDQGGCFVFWRDWRPVEPGLYGQHFSDSGLPQWPGDGLDVDCYNDNYPDFDVVSDGDGGTILSWQIGNVNPDLYVHRIGADGQKLWGEQARLVVEADGGQKAPHLEQDGAGGAYLAWRDSRRGCEDIFAQRLTASGTFLWDEGGVTVAALSGQQAYHDIVAAGADDFIAKWMGSQPPFYGLHAVRIGSGGSGFTMECNAPTAIPPWPNPLPPWPNALRLHRNVPNPFNPRTTIHFELGEAGLTRLDIYDVRGRKVVQLLNEWMPEGLQSVVWNGRSERGADVPPGTYFVRLEQHGRVDTRKVGLIR